MLGTVQEAELLEELKKDYIYNLRLAQVWFKRIGKYKKDIDNDRALDYWQGHLAIAKDINERQYKKELEMGKQKNHIPNFGERLANYVEARGLDLGNYSIYHYRIMDGGFTVLDTWTTGRYWIVATDYLTKYDGAILERQDEKGQLPTGKDELWPFLDKIFFGEDMNEFTDFKESD